MKKIRNLIPFLDSKDLLELAKEIIDGTVDISIEEVLPFMDEEDVEELCKQAANTPDSKIAFSSFFPFASEKGVDALFENMYTNGKMDYSIIPFVSEKALGRFAKQYAENPIDDLDIEAVAPFMNSGDLRDIVQTSLKNGKVKELPAVFPFMDAKDIDEICDALGSDAESYGIDIEDIIPYASQKTVDRLFLSNVKKGKYSSEYLPFVSETCLHGLVKEYCDNPQADIDIDELYPFLDEKDISLIFRAYINYKKSKNGQ